MDQNRYNALFESLPTEALKQTFCEWDEEIFHPGLMAIESLEYFATDSESSLTQYDVDQFKVWLAANPVLPGDI